MEPIVVHPPDEKAPQKPKEDALLANCKYFKNEEKCPFKPTLGDNRKALWFVEGSWYADMAARGDDAFAREIEEFDAYKVGDGLPDDGRPKTLLARIFNRYAAGFYSMTEAAKEFAEFYGLWYGEPSGA